MLEIKDLHVHYGGIHAVQGVSMRIPQGGKGSLPERSPAANSRCSPWAARS